MNQKHILFNLNTFPLVGNIIPLVNKICYWQKHDYSVTIFASYELIEKLKQVGQLAPIETLAFGGKTETTNKIGFMLECLRRNFVSLKYIKNLERQNFPVIYTISSVLDLVTIPALLKYRRNKFIWATVFDNTVPFTGSGNKIIRFLNWLFFIISTQLVKKADRVFVSSDNVLPFLKKRGFSQEQIVTTGNGVEVDLIKQARARKSINIDSLFIGRIHEAKGIYEMLKVLNLVKQEFPKFQLAIMGEGEAKTVEKFSAKIKEMALSSNITFLGYKSGQEKYDIIKSSKSFWFFSEAEGFPQALMEAVSTGLPCFVYRLSAYDYYKNNEIMLFDQKDYRTVAQAVINLFRKKDFTNKAGIAQLKNFSWERIAQTEFESINR